MPAKPKSAFPNPAAVLPGEADILANVIANLADHTAKLVYADWLEERDDPRGPLLRDFINAYRKGKKLPKVKSAPQPWRDLVGITLITKTRGTTLASKTDRLLALPQPAISFRSARVEDVTLSVGESKFGGCPDLPASIKWPKCGEELLAFIGQFNWENLHASPAGRELPETGLFSMFASWDREDGFNFSDPESWQFFYFPNSAELVRREPGTESPSAPQFRSCRLEFTELLTLPGWIAPMRELDASGGDDVCETYDALLAEMYARDHLLGCQMYDRPYGRLDDVSDRNRPRRLLTLWGNKHAGWFCDDDGAFFITLRQSDLHKKRFNRLQIGRHGC
jgi:uncharacterized protein (TIGR02996 family)